MNILISKQNSDFFKKMMKCKTFNVQDQTEHTLTIKLSRNRFNGLYHSIKESGNNPFALMSW